MEDLVIQGEYHTLTVKSNKSITLHNYLGSVEIPLSDEDIDSMIKYLSSLK